jgi:hypothetical protein
VLAGNSCRFLPPHSVYRPAIGAWELVEDWCWERGTIRRGFLYDLASTPSLAWLFGFPPYAFGMHGPLIHDFIYRCKGNPPPEVGSLDKPITRKEADRIFVDMARADGAPAWKCKVAYAAVRLFGWLAWGGRA